MEVAHGVSTFASGDDIGAGAAVEDVVCVVSDQRVGASSPGEVLSVEDVIALAGLPVVGATRARTDRHGGCAVGVRDRVDTQAAGEEVGVGSGGERVVP